MSATGRPEGDRRPQAEARPLDTPDRLLALLAGPGEATTAEAPPTTGGWPQARATAVAVAGRLIVAPGGAPGAGPLAAGCAAWAAWAAQRAGWAAPQRFALLPDRVLPQAALRGLDAWHARRWLLVAGRRAPPGSAAAAGADTPWQRIATALAGPEGRAARLRQVLLSGKDKAIVFAEAEGGEGEPLIVRVALEGGAAAAAEAGAHRLLAGLHAGTRAEAWPGAVPRPLGAGRAGGFAWVAETRLPGEPLSAVMGSPNRAAFAPQASRWLEAMAAPRSAAGPVWAAHVRPRLLRVLAALRDPALRSAVASRVEQLLGDARCATGLVHGDFGTRNLLVEGGRLSGLIDWENAQAEAPLVLDALNYLDSAHRRCHRGRATLAVTLPLLAAAGGAGWPEAGERALLAAAFDRAGAVPATPLPWVWLYLLHHMAPLLAFQGTGEAQVARLEAACAALLALPDPPGG
jgi:aminoglycoside phosphotransferase (APT) family kinase protein